jgi:hypothetical protein
VLKSQLVSRVTSSLTEFDPRLRRCELIFGFTQRRHARKARQEPKTITR